MIWPNLGIGELPKEDWQSANDVRRAFGELDTYVYRFEACLELIEICQEDLAKQEAEDIRLRSTWCLIAERDAAITIWDFSTTIYGIRNSLDRCQSLNALVDRPTLEKVLKQLSIDFPDREEARHAAAHPADMKKSSKEIGRHSVDGPIEKGSSLKVDKGAKGTFLGNFSADGNVMTTYYGKVVEAKITRESLAKLGAIQAQLYECFRPAEKALMDKVKGRFSLGIQRRRILNQIYRLSRCLYPGDRSRS
jgi:hypothetical protein